MRSASAVCLALCVWTLLCGVCSVCSLRVLSVLPTATRSHYAPTRRIVLELARRGHHVVSISPFPEDDPPHNFTWVPVGVTSPFESISEMAEEMNEELSFFAAQRRLWRFTNAHLDYIVRTPRLKHFIEHDRSHFDLVLAEEFLSPLLYVFAHKYNAPLALISTFGCAHYVSEYFGNALELAHVPHEFAHLSRDMTFYERAQNLIFTLYDLVARRYYSLNVQNAMVRDVFSGVRDAPHLAELERRAALVLVNSHFSMTGVRPLLPNIVEVGGVHIEDVKPLDQKLQLVLDGARRGAVLCSFGSVLELSQQPPALVLAVLRALQQLPQTVLLKWNSDRPLPLAADNIHTFKWIPQSDVLAHPNVVVFITHGGLLSAQEAAARGVPTVCVPFYGDQPRNCRRSAELGVAVPLERATLTAERLHGAVRRVLDEPSYRARARRLSARFRDRPQPALDTAVYWLEYCARHGDMSHASSPRRRMYWWQYCYVDLALLLGVSCWLLRRVLYRLLAMFMKSAKVKKN